MSEAEAAERKGGGEGKGDPPEKEGERERLRHRIAAEKGEKGGRPRDLEISSLVFSLPDIYPFRSVLHGTMEEEGDARRR